MGAGETNAVSQFAAVTQPDRRDEGTASTSHGLSVLPFCAARGLERWPFDAKPAFAFGMPQTVVELAMGALEGRKAEIGKAGKRKRATKISIRVLGAIGDKEP